MPVQMTAAQSVDANIIQQLQQLQQLLLKQQQQENAAQQESPKVKFDKKLLDFDYGSEEEDDNTSPKQAGPALSHQQQQFQQQQQQHASHPGQQPQAPAVVVAAAPATGLEMLLSNPEVLRQLQTLQQQMSQQQAEMEEKIRKLQEMKQQEDEFDKHLAQTVPRRFLVGRNVPASYRPRAALLQADMQPTKTFHTVSTYCESPKAQEAKQTKKVSYVNNTDSEIMEDLLRDLE